MPHLQRVCYVEVLLLLPEASRYKSADDFIASGRILSDTGFSANAYIHKIDIVIEKVLIVTTVTNTLLGHK